MGKSSSSFLRESISCQVLVTGILGLDWSVWRCSTEAGPAGTTVMSLYENGMSYEDHHWSRLGTPSKAAHPASCPLTPYLPAEVRPFSLHGTYDPDSPLWISPKLSPRLTAFSLLRPLAFMLFIWNCKVHFRFSYANSKPGAWSECCWIFGSGPSLILGTALYFGVTSH